MNRNLYSCIAITEFEWQAWQELRKLRTLAERWVDIEFNDDGTTVEEDSLTELFDRTPDVMPDSEQSIIIVVGKHLDHVDSECIRYLSDDIYISGIERVEQVYALTARAKDLLEARGRTLGEPIFEQQWIKYCAHNDIRRALENGSNLSEKIIGKEIKNQVSNALGIRHFPSLSSNNWITSSISELFSFQRQLAIAGGNDPIPSHTDLDYCINLGLLARRRLGKKLTDGFKDYGEYLKENKTVDDLVAYVLDKDVELIFDKIQEDEPLDFLVRPEVHLLFLKWKEKFFENSKIEWEGLRSDVKRLIEGDKNVISQQALFLLTCYGGPTALSNLPKDFKKEVGLETSPPFSEIIDPVTPFQLTWGQVFIEKNQDLLGKITICFGYAVLLLQVVLILFF